MISKAEKFAWNFLIEKGTVIDELSYHAGTLLADKGKTLLCLENIKSIDWNKTTPVIDKTEEMFSEVYKYYPLIVGGTLVLKNGTKYEWGYENATMKDVSNFIIEQIIDKIDYGLFDLSQSIKKRYKI